MPHPNSLMYNVYVVPFWPMKMYWAVAKVHNFMFLLILFVGIEDRLHQRFPNTTWWSPRRQDLKSLRPTTRVYASL